MLKVIMMLTVLYCLSSDKPEMVDKSTQTVFIPRPVFITEVLTKSEFDILMKELEADSSMMRTIESIKYDKKRKTYTVIFRII